MEESRKAIAQPWRRQSTLSSWSDQVSPPAQDISNSPPMLSPSSEDASGVPSALRAGSSTADASHDSFRPKSQNISLQFGHQNTPARLGSLSEEAVSPPMPPPRQFRKSRVSTLHEDIPLYSGGTASTSYDPPLQTSLPTAASETAYDPLSGVLGTARHSARSSYTPSRSNSIISTTRNVLSKLGTIRSPATSPRFPYFTNASRYGVLTEGDEALASDARHRSASGVPGRNRQSHNSEEPEEAFGEDISSLTGVIGLNSMSAVSIDNLKNGARTPRDGEPATTEHRLEAAGTLTGGLGVGMSPFTVDYVDAQSDTVSIASSDVGYYGTSPAGIARGKTVRDVGQREANKRNEMVTIKEAGPSVDISTLESEAQQGNTHQTKSSYFFPKDPEMPNWKPVPMRWPYITFLVIFSLATAGVQEFLCQLSMRRAETKDGLLKFKSSAELSTWAYFCWRYLPTIIAVTYGVLWQAVDFEVKRLEPYYQLSRSEGALAIESINLDYLTCLKLLAPFKALRWRQWAVVNCSIANLTAGLLVATLQNASVELEPSREERVRFPDNDKYVRIQPVWSRLLTVSLILVAISGALLLYQLRRKSGLLSDPQGIAGIAAMANKSHILVDFKGLDTASSREIHKRLKHRRYILHKSTLWQGEYVKIGGKEDEDRPVESPHPLMLRLIAGVPFISFMLTFLAFIPVIVFSKAIVIGDNYSWILTAIATVIKYLWNSFECDVRMMEPFFILSRRHAPSETLTLDYTGTVPGWMPIKAFMARHYIVCLMGVGSILVEVLTVCVSSFSEKGYTGSITGNAADQNQASDGPETKNSFWVAFFLAVLILAFLCGTAALVYYRRRHPFLPRQPSTIASVLAYIHQSKMVTDFVDTEKFNGSKMTNHLREKGNEYGLGIFRGRDGETHCGIDYEPLVSNYKHGVRYRNAATPWMDFYDPNV